ncbi:MAG: DEAD/DEAH box helicase [Ginsengibacter sp.]
MPTKVKTKSKPVKPLLKTVVKKSNSEILSKHLQHHFGFDSFKEPQEDIINNLLNGKDTFVIMPTGGGKSLCYQLPALISEGCAIVVSPLIALMKNQVDLIRGYSSTDHIAHFLNSTLNKGQQKIVKDDLVSGKTKMLYVAPETLTKEENVDFFKDLNISFFDPKFRKHREP